MSLREKSSSSSRHLRRDGTRRDEMRYREEEGGGGGRHIEKDGWRREAEATEKPKAKPANAVDWPADASR